MKTLGEESPLFITFKLLCHAREALPGSVYIFLRITFVLSLESNLEMRRAR